MSARKTIVGLLVAIGLLASGFAVTASTANAATDEPTTAREGSAGYVPVTPTVGSELGEAWDAETGEPLRAWACPRGWVCFWKKHDGEGKRCKWSMRDKNWLGGDAVCRWSRWANVKSVKNWSNKKAGVAYYYNRDFGNRIGCTPEWSGGNLTGTYAPRSHRWVRGSCG
jgi:Peptidase inhibitor family I36